MDIQDAFAQESIDDASTELDPNQEAELKTLLVSLFRNNNLEITPTIADLFVLAFVAGRTYQSDLSTMIDVSMSKEMAVDFMHYLVGREAQ